MKKALWLLLLGCLAVSNSALAEQPLRSGAAGPQALSDSDLDAITAGANDDLILQYKQVLNPGNAEIFKISNDGKKIHCVNCDGQTDNAQTSGFLIIIKTTGAKIKCIGGGNACVWP